MINPITALAALHRRGGLVVVTPPEGPPVLRTVIQSGGDLITFATASVSEIQVNQHLAALKAQLDAVGKARARVLAALGTAVAGGGLLTGGLFTEGNVGAWLSWIGGGGAALPVGAGLVAVLRIRKWLKGKGAFGPPRA